MEGWSANARISLDPSMAGSRVFLSVTSLPRPASHPITLEPGRTGHAWRRAQLLLPGLWMERWKLGRGKSPEVLRALEGLDAEPRRRRRGG